MSSQFPEAGGGGRDGQRTPLDCLSFILIHISYKDLLQMPLRWILSPTLGVVLISPKLTRYFDSVSFISSVSSSFYRINYRGVASLLDSSEFPSLLVPLLILQFLPSSYGVIYVSCCAASQYPSGL